MDMFIIGQNFYKDICQLQRMRITSKKSDNYTFLYL